MKKNVYRIQRRAGGPVIEFDQSMSSLFATDDAFGDDDEFKALKKERQNIVRGAAMCYLSAKKAGYGAELSAYSDVSVSSMIEFIDDFAFESSEDDIPEAVQDGTENPTGTGDGGSSD